MRTIKFRGKRQDNGEWIYGSYHYCVGPGTIAYWDLPKDGNRVLAKRDVEFNSHWILVQHTPSDVGWDVRETFTPYNVIPETVGQATGHKIKDVELFEGDIVRVEEDAEGNDPEDVMNWYVVTWIKEWCMFALLHTQNEYFQYLKDGKAELDEPLFWTFPLEEHKDEEHKYFLCGNLFDNPELLINK